MKNVIRILTVELNENKAILKKLNEAYEKGTMSHETYNMHLKRLDPLIKEFSTAIKILNDNNHTSD